MAHRQRTRQPSSSGSWLIALLLLLVASPLLLHLITRPVVAQPPIIRRALIAPAAVAPGDKAKAGDDAADAMKDIAEEKFPGGAPLKTDPEQQRLLKRADICVADGRFDLATVLWQKVLDEAGDTLMTRDGRFYTSLAEEVERTIIQLPPEALRTYRLTADGQAELILSKAGADEENALAEVVRRYFMSAVGDDAAYKLACLALDRHDFVGASRLLTKIIEQHPDPSMPKSEVLLRLGVASARMGDGPAAKSWLMKSASASGARPSSEVFDLVIADAAEATQQVVAAGSASENWPMLLGGGSRTGHMRSLPSEATAHTLTEAFVYQFPLAAGDSMTQNPWGGMMGSMGLHGRPFQQPGGRNVPLIPREPLVNSWRQHGWTPTAQLLFDQGKVIVKTADELVAFNSAASEREPAWQTVMQNEYNLDGQTADMSRMQQQGGMVAGGNTDPRSVGEVFLFGDRVHQSMSMHKGLVYCLEGKSFDAFKPPIPGVAIAGKPWQWNVTPRRTRSNFLAAYQVSSGKYAGRRAASDEDKEGSQDVGFLGAPVGFGNLLLVPVSDGGAIWLYALEEARMKQGDNFMPTVWKCYLCDEPSLGCNPWSTIIPALDGRELYLTCGTGVVFAVDAVSGTVRWATRYTREGTPDLRMRNYGNMQNRQIFREWEDDVVIPHGRALIVMASDNRSIFALDRRTGEVLWNSPRFDGPQSDKFPAHYCLGVKGSNLYVAGKNIVRCIKVTGGRRVWEKEIEDSYGHGALTGDALYMPVRDSILKLDLETGKDLGQVGVALPTDDPVGNVYSDGEKLWVAGAGRVYAMTSLAHRLKTLDQQISAGDAEAQLTRMRLMFKDDKLDLALADLRGAYQLLRQKVAPDESVTRLFNAMHELKLPQDKPLIALDLLQEMFVKGSPPPITDELKAKRGEMLLNSLRNARQQKSPQLTASLLGLAPLLDTDHLVHTASAAIQATATAEDRERLTAAINSDQPITQAISIGGLAKIAGAEAKESLTKLLMTGDERSKLSSARALANLGERASLKTFVELLNAENPRTRLRSHQALRALSGKQISFSAEAKAEDRAKTIDEWKKWVDGDGQTAKLTVPLPENDLPLGRLLFVSYGQSTVVELDADKKERWRARVMNPWCCQGLPNGNRLIAGFAQGQNSVIEYNEEGKEIWRKDRLPGIPYSVQRLENGNTLVACKDQQQIVEISPDGTTKSMQVQGHPMHAQRLENGNTLIALQQGSRVIEMDAKNQIMWEARNMNGPCFAQRLDNGNTLIVQMHTGQVVEVDAAGKTTWTSRVPLVNPMCAQRLANGNTLIADNNGVTEVDAAGQQVKWRHAQNNVTGVSAF